MQINHLGRSNEARGESYRDKRRPIWKCDHRCTQALTIISREVAEVERWCSLKTTLMGTTINHRWRSQARIIRSSGATSMDRMGQQLLLQVVKVAEIGMLASSQEGNRPHRSRQIRNSKCSLESMPRVNYTRNSIKTNSQCNRSSTTRTEPGFHRRINRTITIWSWILWKETYGKI